MRIREIILQCNDLSRAGHFYQEKLGLKILEKTNSEISFDVGSSVLTFQLNTNIKPVYHFAFNIPCNQIEQAERWLETKATILEAERSKIADFKNWNAKSVYFLDENGNVLECIARNDLKNECDLRFTKHSFFSISEIGIVTEDIRASIDEFYNKYRIPVFSKQPVLKNFAAIGDDHGLLILSSPDRHWYPTEIEASHFPLTVKLEQNNINFELNF